MQQIGDAFRRSVESYALANDKPLMRASAGALAVWVTDTDPQAAAPASSLPVDVAA
jgi:hypothetical protein